MNLDFGKFNLPDFSFLNKKDILTEKNKKEKLDPEELSKQIQMYTASKKALIDLKEDPLNHSLHATNLLVTTARAVTDLEELLRQNGVDVDALNDQIIGNVK